MRTLRDLKIVRSLAAHRNFARSADELGMSQPALSRALARLEDEIGVHLFERSRTSVCPTVFAEIVLNRCDNLIGGFEDIQRAIRSHRQADQEGFRVSAGPFAAEAVCYRALSVYAANFRRATGSMTVRDWRTCIDDVLEGRSDIAVTDVPSADVHPELTAERLGERPAAFFCHRSHPLFDRRGCTWDDVMRYPWALTRTQSRWLHLLPPDLGSAGRVDPETGDFVPAICVDSFAAMTAAVRNGRAISVASPGFIRSELERREFRLLDLDEPRMRISYGVIRRRDAVVGKALAAFIETLREAELACREAEREPAAFEWEPRPHRAVALTPAPRALVTTGPAGPPAR